MLSHEEKVNLNRYMEICRIIFCKSGFQTALEHAMASLCITR